MLVEIKDIPKLYEMYLQQVIDFIVLNFELPNKAIDEIIRKTFHIAAEQTPFESPKPLDLLLRLARSECLLYIDSTTAVDCGKPDG